MIFVFYKQVLSVDFIYIMLLQHPAGTQCWCKISYSSDHQTLILLWHLVFNRIHFCFEAMSTAAFESPPSSNPCPLALSDFHSNWFWVTHLFGHQTRRTRLRHWFGWNTILFWGLPKAAWSFDIRFTSSIAPPACGRFWKAITLSEFNSIALGLPTLNDRPLGSGSACSVPYQNRKSLRCSMLMGWHKIPFRFFIYDSW